MVRMVNFPTSVSMTLVKTIIIYLWHLHHNTDLRTHTPFPLILHFLHLILFQSPRLHLQTFASPQTLIVISAHGSYKCHHHRLDSIKYIPLSLSLPLPLPLSFSPLSSSPSPSLPLPLSLPPSLLLSSLLICDIECV